MGLLAFFGIVISGMQKSEAVIPLASDAENNFL